MGRRIVGKRGEGGVISDIVGGGWGEGRRKRKMSGGGGSTEGEEWSGVGEAGLASGRNGWRGGNGRGSEKTNGERKWETRRVEFGT